MADAIGVAVRAGVVTPQIEDEKEFRKKAGLAEMSAEVVEKWKQDGGVRAPITLANSAANAPAPAVPPEDADA
ncbi:MAG: hypothetical protein WCT35_04865 [Sideroxydans sp.]